MLTLKLGVKYGTGAQGFQLVRDKHHIKILSKHRPIRIREWVVRERGLVKSIMQLRMVAENQDKPHLVQRYQHILNALLAVQTDLRQP